MNLAQRRSIMKAFICSLFGYCPLVWMFHSRKINNRTNCLHERALSKDKSVTFHQRNLQIIATDIFQIKNELNPKKLWKKYSHLKAWTTIFDKIHL